MFRTESQRAARNFVEDLRSVLDKCAKDTHELKRAYNKGPLGTGAEAVSFSTSLRTDMEQIRSEIPMLESFSRDTPRAHEMLSAAFEQLESITKVFDRFEERLESGYGIAPVKVPMRELREEPENDTPNVAVTAVHGVPSIAAASLQNHIRSPHLTTPSRQKTVEREEVDLPIPKTPQLADFGISNEDLRGLGMASPHRHNSGNTSSLSAMTPQHIAQLRNAAAVSGRKTSDVNLGSGDLDVILQRSISELGIETPIQVAEKFENRRHRALTKMMVTATPTLKSGGRERIVDYTGLAGGYYAASAKKEGETAETHRQLNFDETPRVRKVSSNSAAAISQRISDNYESLGLWRQRVTCETLQKAAEVLQSEGDRSFDKHELMETLGRAMPGLSYFAIIISLTKLKVLHLESAKDEEATYRLVCAS